MGDERDQTRLVFFDGECHLCHAGMQFLRRHDRARRLQYSSLQSDTAQSLLGTLGLDTAQKNSVIFYDQGVMSERSTAALNIAAYLDRPWSWLRFLAIIPRPIRDAIYDTIARNRYRWFGRQESCERPTPPNE